MTQIQTPSTDVHGLRPRRFALLLACAAVLVATAGCGASGVQPSPDAGTAPTTTPAPGAGAAGTIVFDRAHGEIFPPEDTSQLGQSQAVERMRAAGYEVRVNTDTISPATLDGVAAVYVPGPMRPFTAAEQQLLDDYLARGGTIVLTIHVPYPVLSIPAKWGLPVGTGVMALTAPGAPGNDPSVFYTENIAASEITQGVKRVVIFSGWPLKTDPTRLAEATMVVSVDEGVVADTNNDRRFDSGDDQPPFGVVGIAPVGSGRVIIMSDDAIFANVGINEGDNGRLLDNILKLIKAPRGA